MRNKGVVIFKNKPKFELGEVVITLWVYAIMISDISFQNFLYDSLQKYAQCDWGDISEEDKKSNDNALKDGEQIHAVYTYRKTNTTIWIITEWDRSVTTILFPDEY